MPTSDDDRAKWWEKAFGPGPDRSATLVATRPAATRPAATSSTSDPSPTAARCSKCKQEYQQSVGGRCPKCGSVYAVLLAAIPEGLDLRQLPSAEVRSNADHSRLARLPWRTHALLMFTGAALISVASGAIFTRPRVGVVVGIFIINSPWVFPFVYAAARKRWVPAITVGATITGAIGGFYAGIYLGTQFLSIWNPGLTMGQWSVGNDFIVIFPFGAVGGTGGGILIHAFAKRVAALRSRSLRQMLLGLMAIVLTIAALGWLATWWSAGDW